ncbi:MAG: hypothetical protein KBT03_10985 [Bacteroidales bacterium]|nr:hypothetical protein [Candidatus Scybalousia scybalohippi]
MEWHKVGEKMPADEQRVLGLLMFEDCPEDNEIVDLTFYKHSYEESCKENGDLTFNKFDDEHFENIRGEYVDFVEYWTEYPSINV